jgi:hypothetical protein
MDPLSDVLRAALCVVVFGRFFALSVRRLRRMDVP